MPLLYKPHRAKWLQATVRVEPDQRAGPPTWIERGELACQVLAKNAGAVYQDWAIELSEAWLLLADPGLAAEMTVGDRVEVDGLLLEVAAPPRILNAEKLTSHVAVLLQRVQYDHS